MGEVRSAILGTGRAYPEGILTNADLENIVETSDDWITSRTGIKERHRAAEGEYTSLFAVRAARQAIERARDKKRRPQRQRVFRARRARTHPTRHRRD